jgi:hypothetical protein
MICEKKIRNLIVKKQNRVIKGINNRRRESFTEK